MIILCAFIASLCWVIPLWRRWKIVLPARVGHVDQAVILDLAAASLAAGVSIPTMLIALDVALMDKVFARERLLKDLLHSDKGMGRTRRRYARIRRVDSAGAGRDDRTLREVANMLMMGASWNEAWENVPQSLKRLEEALAPAWVNGVAPVALLERAAQSLRISRARRAKEAAARLGSALVLPLTMCFLPAFILIGVVPVIVAAAGKIF